MLYNIKCIHVLALKIWYKLIKTYISYEIILKHVKEVLTEVIP